MAKYRTNMDTFDATTSTTVSDQTYLAWVEDSIEALTNVVWTKWQAISDAYCTTSGDIYTATTSNSSGGVWQPERHVVTPEEDRRRRAEGARRMRESKRKQRTAGQRARALLWQMLDAEQRAMLRDANRFRVVAASGRLYEIDASKMQHNLFRLNDQGERIEELCVFTTHNVPLEDNALAQMLHLVGGQEDHLRQTANRWPLNPETGQRTQIHSLRGAA